MDVPVRHVAKFHRSTSFMTNAHIAPFKKRKKKKILLENEDVPVARKFHVFQHYGSYSKYLLNAKIVGALLPV